MSDTTEPTSFEQTLAELPNVHDPAQRAIVLALLAVTEELMLIADATRELAKTANRQARRKP